MSPAVEVWSARLDGRAVVLHRYPPARPGSPWPPPPDPAVLAAVTHPGLVRFLDRWREDDGTEVHAFASARGESLADVLARGPLAPERWTHAVSGAARGLRWLHERCPVFPRLHGDVSPRNLLLTPEGNARWLDVRADRPGTFPAGPGVIVGTLPYLAPEVLRGGAPVQASEIFALGLVALAAATGPLPWRTAASPAEVLAAFARASPASLAAVLPGPAAFLLDAMLAPSPADRPSAGQVATWLR